jgi:DNA repair exonuclease SbcCD ATPase subunit
MFQLLRKWQRRSQELPEDIIDYKHQCEQLVNKYETLLDQISQYMQTEERILGKEEAEITPPPPQDMGIFELLTIKGKLLRITEECDQLMNKGFREPTIAPLQKEAMELLIGQLQNLRQYSDQIEEALLDFEEKLMEMEELASNRGLCN